MPSGLESGTASGRQDPAFVYRQRQLQNPGGIDGVAATCKTTVSSETIFKCFARKAGILVYYAVVKFSLSTNWCNRRIESGEEIAKLAASLGFDEIELGYNTTDEQANGFKKSLDVIPVGSVHAFCPVPLSAPQGYPELYQLASFDEEGRKMAHFQVVRNIRFAAEVGADAVVLHMGRVKCRGLISRLDARRRVRRGRKMLDVARREIDALIPELESCKVTLALENLPYLEGFPAEWEIGEIAGEWVRPWLDTGHDFVRAENGWKGLCEARMSAPQPVGLHISDSLGGDDHLPPGKGKVDFAALKDVASGARHLVFEPNSEVTGDELRAGLEHLKTLWCASTT